MSDNIESRKPFWYLFSINLLSRTDIFVAIWFAHGNSWLFVHHFINTFLMQQHVQIIYHHNLLTLNTPSRIHISTYNKYNY